MIIDDTIKRSFHLHLNEFQSLQEVSLLNLEGICLFLDYLHYLWDV